MKYRNNTGLPSKVGYVVVNDTAITGAFKYAPNNTKNVLGIVGESVSNGQMCEIHTAGTVMVFVNDTVVYGDKVRARKQGDRGSLGQASKVTTEDSDYFLIGNVVEKRGKGLVRVNLNLDYVGVGSGYAARVGRLYWSYHNSDVTIDADQGVIADTSAGSFNITLPANPVLGDTVGVMDYSGTFHTNSVFIIQNGHPIHNIAEDLECNVDHASFLLTFTGDSWKIETYLAQGIPFDDIDIYVDTDPNYAFIEYLRYNWNGAIHDVTTLLKRDGLLDGGIVVWNGTGYDFDVSAAAYILQGVFYTSPQTLIQLSAPDATYDRIDVVAVDESGQVVVIEGIPAASPIKPQIDPVTQLELTPIFVLTGTTTPPYISGDVIYDENIEWTSNALGVTDADYDDLDFPFQGLKAANFTSLTQGDRWEWVNSSPLNSADYETLSYRIRLKEAMTNQHHLVVNLFYGATPLGSAVVCVFDKSIVGSYQLAGVPISSFGVSGLFDRVIFTWLKQGAPTAHLGLYMDIVKLEAGVVPPPPSGVIPVNDILQWHVDRYRPYPTGANGVLDSSSTDPTDTKRLNYGGYFHASRIYSTGGLFSGAQNVFSTYGSGTYTGTATKLLAVDINGNVIEEDLPTPATNYWQRVGTTLSPATAGDRVEVASNNSNGAIKGTSTDYMAVQGISTYSYGIYGSSSAGVGTYGGSYSNYGIYASSVANPGLYAYSYSNVAATFIIENNSGNTIQPVIALTRKTDVVASAGIGAMIDCYIENGIGSNAHAGYLYFELTDVTNLSERAGFGINLISNGTFLRKLYLSDIGKLTLDTYGDGTHTGTPTTTLNSDTDGNVIETTYAEYPSLKVGDVSGGNYTEIEADGTIKMHGDATVFKDELSELITKRIVTGADKVVINSDEGSVTYKSTAGLTDYVVTSPQLNHDRKLGSAIYPHIHWWQTSVNMPNWLLQYRWQIQGASKTTAWTYLPWATNVATFVSDPLNQITGFGAIAAPTGDGISDIVQFRLIRDVDNTSTEFDGAETSPIDQDVVNFDIHIEIDTVGSRQEYVK